MDIKAIRKEVDKIITNTDNKQDYKLIYSYLDQILTKPLSYSNLVLICETVYKIANTKNRVIRFLEKDFWYFLDQLIAQIMSKHHHVFELDEELMPNTDYKEKFKKLLSKLLGFAIDILEIEDDYSMGSELRRTGALKLIGQLIDFYHLPYTKFILLNSINSKSIKEQYASLEALENYYNVTDDDIDANLKKTLNSIKDQTHDRSIAYLCLQIQIIAGAIDELAALSAMDKWKAKNRKYI